MEDHLNTTKGVVERSSEYGNEIQNTTENKAGDIVPTFEVDCNNYNTLVMLFGAKLYFDHLILLCRTTDIPRSECLL